MALEGSIARRYARALHQIGIEQGNLERLFEEVSAVERALASSAELRHVLSSPMFALSDRKKVMSEITQKLGASPVTSNFLFLLLDRRRLENLADIVRELGALVDAQAGRVRAQVSSAAPLNDTYVQTLTRMLEERLGKQVVVEQKQDPT